MYVCSLSCCVSVIPLFFSLLVPSHFPPFILALLTNRPRRGLPLAHCASLRSFSLSPCRRRRDYRAVTVLSPSTFCSPSSVVSAPSSPSRLAALFGHSTLRLDGPHAVLARSEYGLLRLLGLLSTTSYGIVLVPELRFLPPFLATIS